MSETLANLAKVLPQLAILVALAGLVGWWLRGPAAKPAPAKGTAPATPKPARDRAANLEDALEKSKAANKSLKGELEALKAGSISRADHDLRLAELEAAHTSLATESKRTAALETELRKTQESLKAANNRLNEAEKSRKDRSFILENELSKVREELAQLQSETEGTGALQAEIERLRDTVATTTRYAGELRKREAAALEALEKANARPAAVASPSTPSRPAGESDRVAAAKAEVLRLIELNRSKSSPTAPVPASELGAPQTTPESPESADAPAASAPQDDEVKAPESLPA